MADSLSALSDAIAALAARAAPFVLSLHDGARPVGTATVWQPGIAIASEQVLPKRREFIALGTGGARLVATVAGRDPGTNVAVLRLGPADAIPAPDWHIGDQAAAPRLGRLVVAIGCRDGAASVRTGVIHRVGPAWDSMAGGRLDHYMQFDMMLTPREEGGPVLDDAGALLGMATLGPRRRAIAIPAATLGRIVPPLLAGGRVNQGWLGLGLQPVDLPPALRQAAERDSGLMVVSLAAGGPAEQAGVLPGDILLDVAGVAAPHPRSVSRALAAEPVGKAVPLRLLRAGVPLDLHATVAMRPAA